MAKRKNPVFDNQLDVIEAHLAGTLRPIAVSSDTIQRLRERIHLSYREEIVLRLRDWKRMVLVFGGVMSGMLVLMTVARAFFYFWGRRG